MVEIKFCGLTRAADAARAAELGASYVGAIFAGGPRALSPQQARDVFAAVAGAPVKRVGVLGAQGVDEALRIADVATLDILQLSYGADRPTRVGLRTRFTGALWAVVHVAPDRARAAEDPLAWFDDGVDALVLDAAVPGKLGGTGVSLDWRALAPEIARLRRRGRVVLAGGLRQDNIAEAVTLAQPDVVDVSSGVESAPGIKDPERMRAFVAEARQNEVR